jgi:hypothetical protein
MYCNTLRCYNISNKKQKRKDHCKIRGRWKKSLGKPPPAFFPKIPNFFDRHFGEALHSLQTLSKCAEPLTPKFIQAFVITVHIPCINPSGSISKAKDYTPSIVSQDRSVLFPQCWNLTPIVHGCRLQSVKSTPSDGFSSSAMVTSAHR